MIKKAKDWREFGLQHLAYMSARFENKPFCVINWAQVGMNKKFVEYLLAQDCGLELVLSPAEAMEVKRERARMKNAEYREWKKFHGR